MLTKIGFIGDVHAGYQYLGLALDYLQKTGLETIVCTGDLADTPEDFDLCCDLLLRSRVYTVIGNHDEIFQKSFLPLLNSQSQGFIRELPYTRDFQTAGGNLLLCHGIGPHVMRKVREDDYGYALESNFELHEVINSRKYRFMLNGHTHWLMVRTINGLTIVNAGTLLMAQQPCFGMLDLEEMAVTFWGIEENDGPRIFERKKISL